MSVCARVGACVRARAGALSQSLTIFRNKDASHLRVCKREGEGGGEKEREGESERERERER